ncbi:hypothetical protein [Bacillus sp. UNC437CL72CviS29]|uniref:hypothetical protein n=1 Tax=Bacillus sp. UNC437CL72CviS29 TaxID=1340430 RepID=UPI000479E102|nr:hypothetical protein [Bacillus sp. UNC437CL72CviS29]
MAKLDNVKVVNENTVEYNGFVYEFTNGHATDNDLVRFKVGYCDIDSGSFYEVNRIDSYGDVEILDNDMDERYFDADDSDFDVFRKSHAITNDKLTDAEGVVTITLPDGTKLEGTPSDLEKITRSMQALQNEQVSSVELPEEAVEVKGESESVSERLQVGVYAKLIVGGNGYSKAGDVIKIVKDDESVVPFKGEHLDEKYSGWHCEDDLVKATDEEVLVAKQALLEEGDFARVVANTANHRFEIGTVVNIRSYRSESDSFTAYYLDESDFWAVYRRDLEPLTVEEAEHISREAEEEKKAKAEREEKEAKRLKWAGIGREVGELRNGDVVQFNEDTGAGDFPEGSLAIIANVNGEDFSFGEHNEFIGDSKWVELIVPVEQRFNKAE